MASHYRQSWFCLCAFLFCASTAAATTITTSTTSTTRHSTTSNAFYSASFSTLSGYSPPAFTGTQYTYDTASGQATRNQSSSSFAPSGSALSNSTTRSRTTSGVHLTTLGGGHHNSTTATKTSSSATATNTVPCNGHPEFCNRSYSNITQVCAHNSAFVVPNNAGSNQALQVSTQLDDGIRMIQGETHYVNDTIYNCHSTCKLLNAGPWVDELNTVVDWLRRNPYEVVTWLIVNSDFVSVEKYVPAIEQSGMRDFLYEPQYVPQRRDQWPTLGEMILTGKRVVMFMDYNADQDKVPYILDEFTHIWETPFSPTNPAFPCTQQRPPGLNQTRARDEYMYLANHNLNTAVDLSALLSGGSGDGSQVILIPNTAEINRTNGAENQYSQLEAASLNCTAEWGRPPNFLLVDYYNYGTPRPGSVFEVAARANGVSYNYHCCGGQSSAAAVFGPRATLASLLAAVLALLFFWIL